MPPSPCWCFSRRMSTPAPPPDEVAELRAKVGRLRELADAAERDASRTLFRATRLAQVVKVLGEHTDLERLSTQAVAELAELFGSDITLLLVGKDGALEVRGSWGLRPAHVPKGPVDLTDTLKGDVTTGPVGRVQIPGWLSPYGLAHVVVVRLSVREESLGVLLLGRRAEEPFEAGDARELRAMATRIALAIDNGLLHRRMTEQLEQLRRLYAFTTDLAATLDLGFGEVSKAVVSRVAADSEVGAVSLYVPEGHRLHLAATYGGQGNFCEWLDREELAPGSEISHRAFPLKHGTWDSGALVVERMPKDPSDARSLLAHVTELAGLVVEKALLYDDTRRQALRDPLTGLPNRTLLHQKLATALRAAERAGSELAVIFLDLDRFKVINDSLGHGAGDALLIEVSKRLRDQARKSDTVARLGGDEFVVLCEDLRDPADVLAVAARIQEAVGGRPVLLAGSKVTVTASQGIALTATSGFSTEALLRDADIALYRAKGAGRDRCEVFDEHFRNEAVSRLGGA